MFRLGEEWAPLALLNQQTLLVNEYIRLSTEICRRSWSSAQLRIDPTTTLMATTTMMMMLRSRRRRERLSENIKCEASTEKKTHMITSNKFTT